MPSQPAIAIVAVLASKLDQRFATSSYGLERADEPVDPAIQSERRLQNARAVGQGPPAAMRAPILQQSRFEAQIP
jgi:hypothetical protein